MLYRRFDYLQARLLLYKQDELRELEADLDHIDLLDEKEDPSLLRSRDKDDALSGRRRKLLTEMQEKFYEYGPYSISSLPRTLLESIVDRI